MVTRLYDFTNGTTADADEVDEELNQIISELGTNVILTTGAQTKAGVLTLSDTPKMDAIAEKTAATGVTIDGLLIKDGDAGTIATTIASSATPTPAIASRRTDYAITALAEAATFGAPTGSPINGYSLLIRIKDNATARALGWNAIYRIIGTTLPTTTVISKTLYLGFIYNSTDTKWDCLATGQEE